MAAPPPEILDLFVKKFDADESGKASFQETIDIIVYGTGCPENRAIYERLLKDDFERIEICDNTATFEDVGKIV